jgi:predicted RecA/RadA family phage recombinase
MIDNFIKDGNSIKLVSPEKDYRMLDAWGDDVVKYSLEAGFPTDDTTTDPLGWTSTVVEAGTGTTNFIQAVTGNGDIALITTAANEYDGGNYQLKGEVFDVTSGKKLYFGAKIKVSDATQSDLFVGLAETDATLLATSSAHAIALAGDGLFFSKLDAGTTIAAKSYVDGSETNTANVSTALDTAYHWYEIVYDGVVVKFYFDGELVTTFTADFPDGEITPSINFRAGAAAAKTLTIANLKAFAIND